MIPPLPLCGAILPPATHWAWTVFAAALGVAAGRVLVGLVGGLLDRGVFADPEEPLDAAPPPAPGRAIGHGADRRWIVIAAATVAAALWWWEVRSLGLHADGAAGPGPGPGELVARWAAHAVHFAVLAAATWIDLRHRVIPDGVTLPGVLLGLVTLWARPDVLLPVTFDIDRAYGPPLRQPDVLAWYGGLESGGGPEWMGPAPHLAGLLVSLAIFLAWWSVCTAPWLEPDPASGRSGGRWRIEPRTLVLFAGVVGIAAAWWLGGARFAGLASGLVGVAVAAGLVWSVREGASRALGREAMGLGDVTLMAMVGAWVGWQAAVVAFFAAAFLGLGHGLVQVVRHRESELPYGPSLCLASGLVIVGWRWLWPVVAGAFADPLLLAAVLGAVVGLTAATLAVWQRLRG